MELHRTLAEIAVKTDRLVADVGARGRKIENIRSGLSVVEGTVWMIGGLVAAAWAASFLVVPRWLGQ